jgi:hypothetical protein
MKQYIFPDSRDSDFRSKGNTPLEAFLKIWPDIVESGQAYRMQDPYYIKYKIEKEGFVVYKDEKYDFVYKEI